MFSISVVNAKGGVAKTTTALYLASYLSSQGYKVLCIDLDPQANATKELLKIPVGADAEGPTLFEAFKTYVEKRRENIILDCVRKSEHGFDVLPATQYMETYKDHIKNYRRSLDVLNNLLDPLREQYDYAVIDCPADLSIYVENALNLSDFILCPTTYDYFGLDGLSLVLPVILDIKEDDSFSNYGILYTMHNARATKIQKDLGDLASELEAMGKVLPFKIPVDQNVKNAQAKYKDLMQDKAFSNSRARIKYRDLGNWMIEKGPAA